VPRHVRSGTARLQHPAPPIGFDELTRREREIFGLIANGLSNAEIGLELYISETTVKTQVTHVFWKLNGRDRVQAVVLAYQTRLVEPDA
jgi:DNA-binding NarL/FixJ family response regulator